MKLHFQSFVSFAHTTGDCDLSEPVSVIIYSSALLFFTFDDRKNLSAPPTMEKSRGF